MISEVLLMFVLMFLLMRGQKSRVEYSMKIVG